MKFIPIEIFSLIELSCLLQSQQQLQRYSQLAGGPNSIRTTIFKTFGKNISVPLTELINLSFNQGKFPAVLKIASVTPTFKKGDFSIWVFLSRPFTIHRTAGEGGRHFFNSSLPLPSTSQTLRDQLGDYCRELPSAHRYQPT